MIANVICMDANVKLRWEVTYFIDSVVKVNVWLSLYLWVDLNFLICLQKKKFSIKNFISKFDQIRRKLRIWSHLERNSLMENFIFCAVLDKNKIAWIVPMRDSDFLHEKMIEVSFIWSFYRSSRPRCSVKKVFLGILQNSQESTCTRVSFLIKSRAATLLKKRLRHRCFPVNFAKFLSTPFVIEHLCRLLLFLGRTSFLYVVRNVLKQNFIKFL